MICADLETNHVDGLKPASTCLWTVPRAQVLLRGRAWVAQLWAKSVGAVRLRALPFFLVQQRCRRVGVSRCGLAAAVVGGGVRCSVGVNLSSSVEVDILVLVVHVVQPLSCFFTSIYV